MQCWRGAARHRAGPHHRSDWSGGLRPACRGTRLGALHGAHGGVRRDINGNMKTWAFNACGSVSLSVLLCLLDLYPRNLVAGEVISWGSNRYGQTNAPPDL